MGTREEDARHRQMLRKAPESLRPELEAARRRVEEKAKAARRTKLHHFGLAGGRR